MKRTLHLCAAVLAFLLAAAAGRAGGADGPSTRKGTTAMTIHDFTAKGRNGTSLDLASLKGKVLLVVNTATGCGFTPQYEGLETLHAKYHARGLEILDFPCDQFGHQAPGSDDDIHAFCSLKYHTSFDQLAKIEVNGPGADPIYVFLKAARPKPTSPASAPSWPSTVSGARRLPATSNGTSPSSWSTATATSSGVSTRPPRPKPSRTKSRPCSEARDDFASGSPVILA